MSKRKPPSKKSRQAARMRAAATDSRKPKDRQEAPAAKPGRWHAPSPAAIRETIESVVVAFVLAFLFRTFEAEAFVIPTGSMAPTLMGRHKDVVCQVCDYPYRVSASEEVDSESGAFSGLLVGACTCPMCRHTMDLSELAAERGDEIEEDFPSFKGDRILVGKFAYQLSDPERWDVAVFKYPGDAKTNFIKRLVGLPNEVVWIGHGDVFTSRLPKPGEDVHKLPRSIKRKPPEKLIAMLQPVFDNDLTREIAKYGWPDRWQCRPPSDVGRAGDWQPSEDKEEGGSFETSGAAPADVWLRYQHLVPPPWQQPPRGPLPEGFPGPQLISDFCAYNTNRSGGDPDPELGSVGLHWVGDLAVSCTLKVREVRSDSGRVAFELVEGGRPMQCRIDLATGVATLSIDGVDPDGHPAKTIDGQPYQPTAQTDVREPGEYEILFSNVDDQLRLWVDGSMVEFDTTTCYAPLRNTIPKDNELASDLRPVGIGSCGAAVRVSHLKVLRDIYYIARKHHTAGGFFSDFRGRLNPRVVISKPGLWEAAFDELGLRDPGVVLSEPKLWEAAFDEMNMNSVPFELRRRGDGDCKADQFLALGDNSAKSKDGRLWEAEHVRHGRLPHYVSRDLLIGKALYIYWPDTHYKLRLPHFSLPYFPNFPKMGFIR